MEKKIYATLVKGDHKFGKNDFVLGKIVGIGDVMLKSENQEFGFAMMAHEDGTYILRDECTAEQYEQFKNVIEDLYPGLCIFDYKVPVEN